MSLFYSLNLFILAKNNNMRKLVSFTLIAGVIVLLANCSPKVAKKTASAEPKKTEEVKPASGANATVITNPAPDLKGDVVTNAQGDRSNEDQVKVLASANDQRVAAGGQMYAANCKKCHELHNPGSRTGEQWVEIMKSMGPKAKLDLPSYLTVSSYLVKNARK